jgi:hypothetical protein
LLFFVSRRLNPLLAQEEQISLCEIGFASQTRRLNPLLAQEEQISLCEIGFASQTRRLNPLLAQRGSDFASQNKEDLICMM